MNTKFLSDREARRYLRPSAISHRHRSPVRAVSALPSASSAFNVEPAICSGKQRALVKDSLEVRQISALTDADNANRLISSRQDLD